MNHSFGPLRRWWDRSRARRDGKRDGLLGVPAKDEVAYPPALLAIKQRGEEALAALQRSWVSRDARLTETTDVTERRSEILAGASMRVATSSPVPAPAPRPSRPATSGPRARRSRPDRGSAGRLRGADHAILVAEFPLNAIAFRLFGESEVLTWVMTAGLAATLILCAHGLGAFLRVPHPTMAERRWIIVLLVLPALAIVGIAVIRERYLSVAAEAGGFDALGPVVGSVLFLVINLLIYAGATMLSYLAHAPGSRADVRRASAGPRAAGGEDPPGAGGGSCRGRDRRRRRGPAGERRGATRGGRPRPGDPQLLRAADGDLLHGEPARPPEPGGPGRAAGAPGDRDPVRARGGRDAPQAVEPGGERERPRVGAGARRAPASLGRRCPMSRLRGVAAVIVLSLLAGACSAVAKGSEESGPLVVVLFDVSGSTDSDEIRAGYLETFGRVLDFADEHDGTVIADVVDENPLAHSTYPVNATFEACNALTDNQLTCDTARGRRAMRR